MSNERTTAHAVMEAGGNYNLHATVQAAGGDLALPLLEQVVQAIAPDDGNQPVVIADYGSSQGKNSFAPVRTAIRALRARIGPDRPIVVTHVDQPANDFNALFGALHQDPDRYTCDDPNVFPSVVGRSFYEQVFPANHVHLGWSAYAVMWLSRIPTFVSGHFRGDRGTATEVALFRQQAEKDWERFLSLRARELRPGGRLLLVAVGMNDDGKTGFETLMDEANAVLAEMVSEGAILSEERARMVVGSCPRRTRELLAPFRRDGHFQELTVESCELLALKDPTWATYEQDGNKEAMATKRAKIFRATFAPSLACGLSNPVRSGTFADHLESALRRRLMGKVVPFNQVVHTMVLAKRDGNSGVIRDRIAGDRTGLMKQSPATLGDLLHSRAQERLRVTSLFCGDRKMSYRELDQSTTRLAVWMLEQGLKPGDRVAIHWCNSIEVVQLFFAIFKAGLIAVPINPRLKATEVAWVLEHSQAVMCFSEPTLAPITEQAHSRCKSWRHIFTQLPALQTESSFPLPQVESGQPAIIFYTSGSTARPKGVTHSHRTLLEAAGSLADDLLGKEDICFVMTQMAHVVGFGVDLLPALLNGLPAVLLPAFEPGAALDAIERFHCTFTLGLPVLLQLLVDEQARKPRDVTSLRTVLAAGDIVPLQLQKRFATVFGLLLYEGIGMTETYPIAFNSRTASRAGSLGLPRPGVELRIVDMDDSDVADGEVGELVVRSPANCLGYWNDPAATETLLRGGWLHTGDLAVRDADGFFWFKGRKKEIIVRGGSNISPQEVEEALVQHHAVFEAGVIGDPDPIYGERVVAFVSLRNGKSPGEHELRKLARKSLADYKVPERIFFIHELPKTATGKVHRFALKTMLCEMPQ
jgi:long-chain acyl-CoA synthetase